jgi:hypothetical protein
MREARYAGTKTKFRCRLMREARYAETKKVMREMKRSPS